MVFACLYIYVLHVVLAALPTRHLIKRSWLDVVFEWPWREQYKVHMALCRCHAMCGSPTCSMQILQSKNTSLTCPRVYCGPCGILMVSLIYLQVGKFVAARLASAVMVLCISRKDSHVLSLFLLSSALHWWLLWWLKLINMLEKVRTLLLKVSVEKKHQQQHMLRIKAAWLKKLNVVMSVDLDKGLTDYM